MSIASFVLGILSLSGVCLSFLPLLNLANCITLPIALVGTILGIVGIVRQKGRGLGMSGVVLNSAALLVGAIRMLISCLTGACLV